MLFEDPEEDMSAIVSHRWWMQEPDTQPRRSCGRQWIASLTAMKQVKSLTVEAFDVDEAKFL